jgi:quercetin dioxygenase-like cupin family protein
MSKKINLRETSSEPVPGKTGMTRRDACVALSALSILGGSNWRRAEAQAPATAKGTPVLDKSTSYSMAEMPTTKSLNGAVVYHAFIGALTTGELVDVHETTVQGGEMPHPEKKHSQTMIVMVREGTLEFLMEGKVQRVMQPGDVMYSVPNQLHGLRNVGKGPASYFVIAIGAPSKED